MRFEPALLPSRYQRDALEAVAVVQQHSAGRGPGLAAHVPHLVSRTQDDALRFDTVYSGPYGSTTSSSAT